MGIQSYWCLNGLMDGWGVQRAHIQSLGEHVFTFSKYLAYTPVLLFNVVRLWDIADDNLPLLIQVSAYMYPPAYLPGYR